MGFLDTQDPNKAEIVDESSLTADQQLDGLDEESQERQIVIRVNRAIKQALDHRKRSREAKRKDYDFYASHQWDEEDKRVLQEQGRPAVVINRVNKTINAIRGLEVQNRQEATFIPIGDADAGAADLSNESVTFFRKACDAEDEVSESFLDLNICGEGWTESLIDYTSDPDGMYIRERRDPLEMFVDPRSIKGNYDDARFLGHVKAYTAEEMRQNGWDTDKILPAKFSWYDGADIYDDPQFQPRDYPSLNAEYDSEEEPNVFEVYKYQEYVLEDFHRVADPKTGAEFHLSPDEHDEAQEYIKMHGLQTIKQQKKVYKQYIICGGSLLNEPTGDEAEKYAAPVDGFTFRCMTGFRDRNKREWFGPMRLMREPQMWANKFFVQIQHIINTSSKGGKLVYEPGAFLRPQEVETNWALPGKPMALGQGGLLKYKIENGGQYPTDIAQLMETAVNGIQDVIGIDPGMFATPQTNDSGYLLSLKQQTSVTILAGLFDSKRRYDKECARVDIMFVQKYLSDGRMIKIDGDNGNIKFLPLLRDNVNFKYHIEMGESPSSPNMKTKNFEILMALLPQIQQMGIPVPPSFLKLLPLDTKIINDWMQYIDQANQDPEKKAATEVQKGMAQGQLESLQLDNAIKQFNLMQGLPSKVMVDRSTVDLNASKAQASGESNLSDNLINAEIAQISAGAQKTKALAEVIKANAGVKAAQVKAAGDHMKNIGNIITNHQKLTQQADNNGKDN